LVSEILLDFILEAIKLGNMSILSLIFSNSKGQETEDPKATEKAPNSFQGSENASEDMVDIINGESIDMTDRDVKLSAERSSSHLNVARSPLINEIERSLRKVHSEKEKIVEQLPSGEPDKLNRELEVAEDSSAKIVDADINQHEKMVVSSRVLNEASEAILDKIQKMFELKTGIGRRDEKEIRDDMKHLWKEVYTLVDQNMRAYHFLYQNAAEEPQKIHFYGVNSANIFRNLVKVWSKLNRDVSSNIKSLEKWRMNRINFESGSDTIFQEFFE